MAVTLNQALSVKMLPNGLGLHFFGYGAATGDASGGDVYINFTHTPWRDEWVILNRWLIFANNAATDKALVMPDPTNFTDTGAWIGSIDAGTLTDPTPNGCWTIPNTRQLQPVYVGRYQDGGSHNLFSIQVSPNTNTKGYYGTVQGTILFFEPSRIR